jgi:hypothetical protein
MGRVGRRGLGDPEAGDGVETHDHRPGGDSGDDGASGELILHANPIVFRQQCCGDYASYIDGFGL